MGPKIAPITSDGLGYEDVMYRFGKMMVWMAKTYKRAGHNNRLRRCAVERFRAMGRIPLCSERPKTGTQNIGSKAGFLHSHRLRFSDRKGANMVDEVKDHLARHELRLHGGRRVSGPTTRVTDTYTGVRQLVMISLIGCGRVAGPGTRPVGVACRAAFRNGRQLGPLAFLPVHFVHACP